MLENKDFLDFYATHGEPDPSPILAHFYGMNTLPSSNKSHIYQLLNSLEHFFLYI